MFRGAEFLQGKGNIILPHPDVTPLPTTTSVNSIPCQRCLVQLLLLLSNSHQDSRTVLPPAGVYILSVHHLIIIKVGIFLFCRIREFWYQNFDFKKIYQYRFSIHLYCTPSNFLLSWRTKCHPSNTCNIPVAWTIRLTKSTLTTDENFTFFFSNYYSLITRSQ